MIKDIAHICLGASDLDATERFYCGALGLDKTFEFVRGGERIGYYLKLPAGRFIEVFRQDALEPSARHPIRHLCLETDDIDGVRDRLSSRGVKVGPKTLGADRSWQFWIQDPDGVNIEFHEYTPESSQLTGRDCVLE